MFNRSKDLLLGLAAGCLLALMIHYNSALAKESSPVFSSWVAHCVGSITALFFVILNRQFSVARKQPAGTAESEKNLTPWWAYLGGIPGTLTVILAAIAVNGGLALAGTISLMLVGQVLFGIVSDAFGLFGTQKRQLTANDVVVSASVLSGSALIIFGA